MLSVNRSKVDFDFVALDLQHGNMGYDMLTELIWPYPALLTSVYTGFASESIKNHTKLN